MSKAASPLLVLGVVACLGLAPRPPLSAQPRPGIEGGATRAVPGEYVVIFGGGIAGIPLQGETAAQAARRKQAFIDSEAAEAAVVRAGGTIQYRYRNAVIGFAGTLPPAALEAVSRSWGGRARIEPNWKSRQEPGEQRPLTDQGAPREIIMKAPAPQLWAMKGAPPPPLPYGLDRIGQRLLDLNNLFHRPTPGTREVHVYVIDSGMRRSHSEFGSRVGLSYNAYSTAPADNCLKHGTHVAGTVGGRNVGVAQFVKLHSVRVIDCWDDVTSAAAIAGVDWVRGQYHIHKKSSVANMSLEFDLKVPSLDAPIRNSIAAGITFVVAAGNRNRDACDVSPAWIAQAITVASVDPENDRKAGSTGGTCIDLFAPGVAIASATSAHDNAFAFQDGTSSAAPHAAGVAALVLSRHNASPAAVWAALLNAANVQGTQGWCGVGNRGTAPNRLLHWGAGLPHDGKKDSETLNGPPRACSANQ